MALGAFASEESSEFKTFVEAGLRSHITLVHTFDAGIAAKHGVFIPGVAVINQVSLAPPPCNV